MSPESFNRSRRLPDYVKESRQLSRRTEQAAADTQRANIVARMKELTLSFAPSQQQALSSLGVSDGGHRWRVKLCLGKGKKFDDIGRWFRI
ncbi:hypothetical protein CVT26_012423, partial [Gymnopilus dilepis]